MISEIKHDKEVAEMLGRWRSEAGITQAAMAEYIGCSRSEIQKIEYGTLRVKSYTIVKWAEATGHNPILCMHNILYPDSSFVGSDRERKLKRLFSMFETYSDNEIDALSELFLVDHGGDRKALLHLFVCYVRLMIGDKQAFVLLVLNSYRLRIQKMKFKGFQPDLEYVETARSKGAEAYLNGKEKYKL